MATKYAELVPEGGMEFTYPHDPMVTIMPGPDGRMALPFLANVENAYYDRLTGWPHKMWGAIPIGNALGAAHVVDGLFDYWRAGIQRVVLMDRDPGVSSTLRYYSGVQTWLSFDSVSADNAVPCFGVMNDLLITAFGSGFQSPRKWNQTTAAVLGGSPPAFKFHVEHKDRLWGAGADAQPSRLYYSGLGNPEDWTGSGSGSIDVFSDDGYRITGLASHRNELIIFKGPWNGSIKRLVGSAPTGSDAFAVIPMISGIGCMAWSTILPAAGDLLFWDSKGIFSLDATAKYGDYEPAMVSRPIQALWSQQNTSGVTIDLPTIVGSSTLMSGTALSTRGLALWTTLRTGAAGSNNDLVIALDYRWRPPRFILWTAYSARSLAVIKSVTTGQGVVPVFGGYTGKVLQGEQYGTWTVDGAAYTYSMQTPKFSIGSPIFDKGLSRLLVATDTDLAATPSVTAKWKRDTATEQSATITPETAPTVNLSGRCKYVRLQLDHAGTNNFHPQSVGLEYDLVGPGATWPIG